jgi:D-alanyl-D-alanine carboxypeptidase
MKLYAFLAPIALLVLAACSSGTVGTTPSQPIEPTQQPIANVLQDQLNAYLAKNAELENISAGSLSVGLHGQAATIDVATGTTSIGGSQKVTTSSLFQIGSNTKAFTAVALLHLEAAGKLSIHDTVGKWLPEYPTWKNIKITQLLDMTNGIKTYDSTVAWEQSVITHPYHTFSPTDLIDFLNQSDPLLTGWKYSNTGYILSQLIIERASGETYANYIDGIFAQAGLHNTFYEPSFYPNPVGARITSGYYYNTDPGNEGLAPLLRKNVEPYSLSWTQAAGGIVSTPGDIVQWARDLYTGPILNASQRSELETLVSTKTGEPLKKTSKKEPGGFGLGVSQLTRAPIGLFWFYEGETLGFRFLHVYVPATDTTISVVFNSQVGSDVDQAGPFATQVYQTLQAYGLAKSVAPGGARAAR